ncbi:Hypothetical predicted protein [Prunus dulcis]|uniref:Uncharacterized protein n=1 Tax=Prunus dulcis TaxID=3755 RepID=A0A5E4EXD1_PRUDU|nr:Hypothetical predicted protein [Prunus dulcis]
MQDLSLFQDLHDCVEKFLLLPHFQQTLSQECGDKWINELVDGSLRLLYVCGIIKDALLQTKECTHEVQSTMRKRRGGDMSFICDQHVERVAVFESLLSFIAGSKSKSSSWSLVSKLVQPKRVSCEGEETADTNELEKVDAALNALITHKSKKSDYAMQVENVQIWLRDLEVIFFAWCCCRKLVEQIQPNLLRLVYHTVPPKALGDEGSAQATRPAQAAPRPIFRTLAAYACV